MCLLPSISSSLQAGSATAAELYCAVTSVPSQRALVVPLRCLNSKMCASGYGDYNQKAGVQQTKLCKCLYNNTNNYVHIALHMI